MPDIPENAVSFTAKTPGKFKSEFLLPEAFSYLRYHGR